MAVTRTWKVYGAEGHRQRESFSKSTKYDFSENGETRIVEVINSDQIRITRDTAEKCEEEFDGQLSDGVFENSRVGWFEEI